MSIPEPPWAYTTQVTYHEYATPDAAETAHTYTSQGLFIDAVNKLLESHGVPIFIDSFDTKHL